MQFIRHTVRVIFPMSLVLMLTGCAQVDKVWHNREYSYLRQPVSQHASLKTPPGVKAVALQPKYTLPVGPDHYAATTQAFDMAPPNLDKLYTPSELRQFKALQGQTATHLQPLPATKMGLKQRIEQLKAELHGHKADASSTVEPTETKGSAPQTRQQKLKALKKQLSAVQAQLKTLPKSHATAAVVPIPASTVAKAKPVEVKTATKSSPALSSDLSRNDAHQAILTVQASFQTTWQKIGQVLPVMGYKIRDIEKTDGVYFIAPTDKKSTGHTIVLSVQKQGDTHTQVQIYNTQGKVATSQTAFQLLHQLQQHLKAS